ncbi:hypothetical protein [Indiicoccus explosivorum]|uniref:hypothetical protein n=1 Tax=Indiicoccus explosivorum TaxID=1917864 RepID=UPI000B42D053|nr:hypothetical protein [Indiicoccus explosivorum]
MTKITVIDSIMGSGKTQYAIQRMQEATEDERFIYITPYLDEVERIKRGVTSRDFYEPNNANDDGSKMTSLKDLIAQGRDIASTHALFQRADAELVELLTGYGYTLILDEVMDCVETAPVNVHDIKKLRDAGDIRIADDKRVIWIGHPEDNSRYRDIRELAQAGNLFFHRDTFLVWAFPPSVFGAVDSVTIMTYLFRGQVQRYYCELFGFKYDCKAVKRAGSRYALTEYDRKAEGRAALYELMDVYEGKLNNIGDKRTALSANRLRRMDAGARKKMKDNASNFFRHYAEAKSEDAMFSTLKAVADKVTPSGFKKSVIPVNARATNDYAEKRALAYLFNRFNHPEINAFFQDNGVEIDEDMLAVSDLLQWIYRSRIRNGKPIQLYLPSSRMRELLKAWARYEI